jgi:hypothetical protein
MRLYVVTGINRLTGERSVISKAAPLEATEAKLQRWKAAVGRQLYPAYTRLRVEP